MRYELIREIFNLCSNNQMRDVFVSEVETSAPEAVARTYCRGKDVTMDRTDNEDGSKHCDGDRFGRRNDRSGDPGKLK